MTEFQRICLVHYHEIGLKGHNRSTFEMRLLKNLEALLKPFPVVVIHRIAGRLCVFLREGTDWTTAKEAADVIGKVPGVARVSCGFKCERDLDEMTEAALAAKYLPEGSCGVVSFGVAGGRAAAETFMKNLKLAQIATHVADARTCVLHPANATHRQMNDAELEAAGISADLIRLSCGIEDAADLIADIDQALAAVE